jgi:hypothetical protein
VDGLFRANPRGGLGDDMAELAEPRSVTTQDAGSLVLSTEWEEKHQLLIRHYIRILGEVSKLHAVGGRGYKIEQPGGDWSVWKAFVRLFCEAHIRRKLTALSEIYLLQQNLQGLSATQASGLDEAQKSCDRVLNAIPSRQRVKLVLASASPIVVGLLVTALGVDNLYEAILAIVSQGVREGIGILFQSVVLLVYLMLAAVYLVIPFAVSFAYKRGLFFPAVRYDEAANWSKRRLDRNRKRRGLPEPSGANVYDIEDELFALLAFGKPKEPRVDVFVTLGAVAWGLLAWGLFAIAVRDMHYDVMPIATILIIGLGIAAAGRALLVAIRRRWR